MVIADEARNDLLYAHLRAGTLLAGESQSPRDLLILENQHLAKMCVSEVLGPKKQSRAIREDMLGAAILALVESVDLLKTLDISESVTGYLAETMRNAARNELLDAPLIAPRHQMLRSRLRKRGETGETATESTAALVGGSHRERAVVSDELWEELTACCRKPKELEVIAGLAQGLDAKQIAARLEIGDKHVYTLRDQVRARYEERNDVCLAA